MKRPSIQALGSDLLDTTIVERIACLALPFLTMAGFFWAGSREWWFLALFLAMVQSFFTYASVSHDLVHRTLRLPHWLNEGLLALIEGINFRSGHAFRATHFHHHRHFPDPSDLEGAAARMSWWQALLDGVTAQARLWWWAFSHSSGGGRVWIVIEALLVLAGAVVCLFSETGRVYLAVILAGSWIFPLMTSYLPHDAGTDDPERQTRLFRGRVIRWLFFDHLYHLEHHLYPQVPHLRWPELAKRLDAHFEAQGLRPIVLFK